VNERDPPDVTLTGGERRGSRNPSQAFGREVTGRAGTNDCDAR
jgi:hypothetical protein